MANLLSLTRLKSGNDIVNWARQHIEELQIQFMHISDGSFSSIPAALPPSGPAGGDLSGTYPNPDVVDDSHLHTAATLPATIVYDGDPAGGDLSGTYPNPSVVDDSHLHTAATLPPTIVYDGDAAGGDLVGTYPNPTLVPVIVAGGPIGGPTTVPVITWDAKGRLLVVSTATIVGPFPPNGLAGGDLSGTYPNPSVVDDSHNHTAATLPATIVYDGDAAGGDLVGTYPNPTLAAAVNTNARVAVSKNSGATVGTRREINFIEGANITLTIADDAGNEEVDVTIASTGGGGSGTVTSVAGGIGITNTPDPIVAAGTVDLDINSLTTEPALVTGDLFAFVDVSVAAGPTGQRKCTLGNLATSLNTLGTLDHGSLAGLLDDDHARYLYILGRAGGQSAIGGTGSGESIAFQSTSHATRGDIDIIDRLHLRTSLVSIGNATEALMAADQNISFAHANAAINLFDISGTWTHTVGSAPSASRLINFRPTITGNNVFFTNLSTLVHAPTYIANTGFVAQGADGAVFSAPIFSATGGGSYPVMTHFAVRSGMTIDTGVTIPARTGLIVSAQTGLGTVTFDLGVDVGALIGTNAVACRSAITSNATTTTSTRSFLQHTGGAQSIFIGSQIQLYSPTSQLVPTENFVLHAVALKLTGSQSFTLQGTSALVIVGS